MHELHKNTATRADLASYVMYTLLTLHQANYINALAVSISPILSQPGQHWVNFFSLVGELFHDIG
jgi:hypothetical protein